MKKLMYLLPLSILVSCELQGVEGDDLITNDSIKANQNDIAVLDGNGFKLADSINGVPNEMVMMRPDGLRIEWTKKNTSNQIQLNDAVMVNFKARVAGGEEYDSNDPIGEPIPLKTNIGMMVKGWEDGILMMHVGDKGRIMIPNALGYGDDGYLDKVPPQADLIIDIEIVSKIEPIVLDEGVKVYKYKTVEGGANPVKNQLITFDYFAFTIGKDGHLYDNSYKHGEPFSFKFENAGVVEGLHQGMSVIKAGESAFIEIPTELAYGKQGLIDLVPSKTDIVYDVRVISVE
ncbi:MAG: FKBP-type peptidyl-prolyl cis-trans isomerase [Crocinitomicaceae bacterium]|nr:FKBP-type peptidyl-prolyl cis-trans isomerase [Crocinitomicaceae bacterium]MBK9591352.1 FKBP-type peptidyl-prolyl cis-trans isomerase [Crocinitomicaceae bacterium]